VGSPAGELSTQSLSKAMTTGRPTRGRPVAASSYAATALKRVDGYGTGVGSIVRRMRGGCVPWTTRAASGTPSARGSRSVVIWPMEAEFASALLIVDTRQSPPAEEGT
jgi:hypothetical protein